MARDPKLQGFGGAEVQQCLLATRLVEQGYDVSMICADFGQPAFTVVDGISFVRCQAFVGGIPIVRFFHPRLTRLWAALKQVDADIYCHRSAGGETGVVSLFAKRYGRRFVYASASDIDLDRDRTARKFMRRGGWRDRQLYTLGIALADVIVAQHTGQFHDCVRSYGRAPLVIPSGYPKSDKRGRRDGVVLWVSMLRHLKRPELFLELARRLPHLRFRMVGGPSAEPGERELFAQVRSAAQAIPNLEFVGFVPYADIGRHFDDARVFVNTSEWEGFPNTFLQSWSRSIPTVSFFDTASTMGGRPVVTAVSDLDDMTRSIATLMSDDAQWRDTGEHARAYVDAHHSVDAAASGYDSVFRRLCAAPRERLLEAGTALEQLDPNIQC